MNRDKAEEILGVEGALSKAFREACENEGGGITDKLWIEKADEVLDKFIFFILRNLPEIIIGGIMFMWGVLIGGIFI